MTGKGELVKMQFFSVSDEVVSLPKGAWAKSHRINIYWQGRHITSLSQGKYRAYLFPVYTPQGFAVTTESPIDHPHHNSIWIGTDHLHCHLPFSNQGYEEATYNFYVNEVFQGRAAGRILNVSVKYQEVSETHLQITQTLNWQGPNEWGAPQGRILAVETRTINIYPGEIANLIDIRSQLRPTEWELHIGPTRHAYFGIRMSEALRATTGAKLIDSANRSGGSEITDQISDWVDCSGTVAASRSAGISLFAYPSCAEEPWFVSDWGILTVNPLRHHKKVLNHDTELDLAVRIVVHDGDVQQAEIDKIYQAFRTEIISQQNSKETS